MDSLEYRRVDPGRATALLDNNISVTVLYRPDGIQVIVNETSFVYSETEENYGWALNVLNMVELAESLEQLVFAATGKKP